MRSKTSLGMLEATSAPKFKQNGFPAIWRSIPHKKRRLPPVHRVATAVCVSFGLWNVRFLVVLGAELPERDRRGCGDVEGVDSPSHRNAGDIVRTGDDM